MNIITKHILSSRAQSRDLGNQSHTTTKLKNNMYYIYILTNSTHKVLYIGVTNNLQRRVWEHKNKIHDGFSKKYKTDILVYFESAGQVEDAIAREKQLKKWNRQKKESLINSLNPQWNDLFEGMLQ